jgi:alkaline phosphatase D
VLGQQVMMAPVKLPTTTFPFTPATFLEDQWDGYPAERQRLYDSLFAKNIPNMVVLTGDIHTSWANDLPVAGYNSTSGAGSAGVEFVVSSLTSQNFPFPVPLSIIQNFNGHVKYGDLTAHGYMILDVNKTRSQMDWYNLSTITSQNFTTSRAASWYVQNGERFLRNANAGAVVNPNRYTYFAPLDPRGILTSVSEPTEFGLESVLLGVYPNPFQDQLTYHYTVENPSKVRMQLTSLSGQVVQTQTVQQEIGVHRQTVHLDQQLSAGAYIFSLEIGGKIHQRVIVKQ